MKTAEYNGLKSQLGALTRKAGGNLASRDLGDVSAFAAQKQLVVESEHMTTLFAVVPAHSAPEWRGCYEKLAKFVVPRSSKLVRFSHMLVRQGGQCPPLTCTRWLMHS